MNIVIPVKGREELTRRIALYYESLGHEPTLVADSAKETVVTAGRHVIVSSRCPLGDKFNRGINLAWKSHGAPVMIVGSDNLILPEYLDTARVLDYGEIHGCHFFNSATGEMVFVQRYNCGAGKVFGEKVLQASGGHPYDKTLNKNVDKVPGKYINAAVPRRRMAHSQANYPLCIDIKTDESMTSWDETLKTSSYVRLTNSETEEVFARMNGEKPGWWMGL